MSWKVLFKFYAINRAAIYKSERKFALHKSENEFALHKLPVLISFWIISKIHKIFKLFPQVVKKKFNPPSAKAKSLDKTLRGLTFRSTFNHFGCVWGGGG